MNKSWVIAGLLLMVTGLVYSLTYESGGGGITSILSSHLTLKNNNFLRSRNAANTASRNLIGLQSDDRTYVVSRDGSMRLVTGASSNIGIEIDVDQNVDIPIGALTVSTMTMSGLLGIRANAAPRTNITPTAAGQLIWNSTELELCVSTGTTVNTWTRVSDGTSACQS